MPKSPPALSERQPAVSLDPTEPTPAPSNVPAVQPSNVPTVKPDKKVFSYKIRLSTGERFGRYTRYQTDRAVGDLADEALIEYLERHGG